MVQEEIRLGFFKKEFGPIPISTVAMLACLLYAMLEDKMGWGGGAVLCSDGDLQ